MDLFEHLFEPEELLPELQPYLTEAMGMPMIQHPLVYSMFHNPVMNRMVNMQYLTKRHQCEQALVDHDYGQYVFLHEKPYRVWALCHCHQLKADSRYLWWKLLGQVWADSENVWQNKSFWNQELSDPDPQKIFLMAVDGQQAFNQLEYPLQVFRGAQPHNKRGLSWTTNKDKAQWFATRLKPKNPLLLSATVTKGQAIAMFTGRGESEVVLSPKTVRKLRFTEFALPTRV